MASLRPAPDPLWVAADMVSRNTAPNRQDHEQACDAAWTESDRLDASEWPASADVRRSGSPAPKWRSDETHHESPEALQASCPTDPAGLVHQTGTRRSAIRFAEHCLFLHPMRTNRSTRSWPRSLRRSGERYQAIPGAHTSAKAGAASMGIVCRVVKT